MSLCASGEAWGDGRMLTQWLEPMIFGFEGGGSIQSEDVWLLSVTLGKSSFTGFGRSMGAFFPVDLQGTRGIQTPSQRQLNQKPHPRRTRCGDHGTAADWFDAIDACRRRRCAAPFVVSKS